MNTASKRRLDRSDDVNGPAPSARKGSRWASPFDTLNRNDADSRGAMYGFSSSIPASIGGMPRILAKEKEGGLRTGGTDPAAIREDLGEGANLDPSTSARMSRVLGSDFSSVRIHDGDHAAGLAGSMNARAFTVGDHVAFGAGEFRPGTVAGDGLIAHELAHVVQQRQGGGLNGGGAAGETAGLEQDATRTATAATLGLWGMDQGQGGPGRAASPSLAAGLSLQRCSERDPGDADSVTANVTFGGGNHPFAGSGGGSGKTNPQWTTGSTDNGVAYTKGASPTVAAEMDMGASAPDSEVSVRVKEGSKVLGTVSGVKPSGSSVSIPALTLTGLSDSGGVGKREYSLTWEASADGTSWTTVTTTGAHTIYWLLGPPTIPLIERAVEKATGYVDALAPGAASPASVAVALRKGIHGGVVYDPTDGAINPDPLTVYTDGKGVCADFGNLLTYLSQTVGMTGSVLMIWGGFESHGKAIWVRTSGDFVTIVDVKDSPGDPTPDSFSYHVISTTNGGVHDAALDREGYDAAAKHAGKRVELVDLIGGAMPEAKVGVPYSQYIPRVEHTVSLRTRTFTAPILGSDFSSSVLPVDIPPPVPAVHHTKVGWATSGLPAGFTLSDDGRLTGTPTTAGDVSMIMKAGYGGIEGAVTPITVKVNP